MSGSELRERLTAILAADVAGYSRLMALDARATVVALDAARDVFRSHIAAHHGRVIDMAGDSVLAVFETASGAVSAAMATQKVLVAEANSVAGGHRMCFRIGVHLGDVIEKPDGTVYGDGVNIAARLEGLAEPGGITVSDSVYTAVRGKISAAFDDQGEQVVKNLAHPVRAWHVRPGDSMTSPSRSHRSAAAGEVDLSLPDKPSIAVLPFTNMSADSDQEYFADGITEDVITELARFHSLFVIARNSSFTYKSRAVDVRTVGKELGVRYVLEGSIRRAGNRIRITAQLIEAVSGNHVWAEKYDRDLEDVFAVQEELTRAIVIAAAPQIGASEIARAQLPRPRSLSAYEIGLRAFAAAIKGMAASSAVARRQAFVLADQALAIDPACLPALKALASAHGQDVFFRTADRLASYRHCVQASERILAVDRLESHAYFWRGFLEVTSHNPAVKIAGLSALRNAHESNPNDAFAIASLAYGETACGDPVKGRVLAFEALRLSPRDPLRPIFANTLALAHFLSREYSAGLDWAMRAIVEAPGFLGPHEHAALNLVGLGRIDDASREVDWAHRLARETTDTLLQAGWLHLGVAEHRARATLFYRIAAGLEEPAAADSVR